MWAEASPAAVSSLGCEAYALLHLAAIRGGVPGTEQQVVLPENSWFANVCLFAD